MTRCRMCGRAPAPREHKAHPFCSHRCQMADLGRWLGEEYQIPVEADDEGEAAPAQPRAES